jgi:hypothetical protein
LRRIAKKKLRSTVFVDESSFELKREGGLSVYAKKGVQLPPITSSHVMKKAAYRVHYLGGVCMALGVLASSSLRGQRTIPSFTRCVAHVQPMTL